MMRKKKKTNLTYDFIKNNSVSFSALFVILLIFLGLLCSPLKVFSEPNPAPSLKFTLNLPDTVWPPRTLSLYKGDTLVKSWKAGSGISNDPRDWKKPDYGPIPPGKWRVHEEEWMNEAQRFGWLLENITYPGPRYGFWIHDDDDYKTKGCIGLKASPPDYEDFSLALWDDPEVVTAIQQGNLFLYVSYPGVGGIVVPVDKLDLVAPYIGFASTIIVATATTAFYAKRVKHRKEERSN